MTLGSLPSAACMVDSQINRRNRVVPTPDYQRSGPGLVFDPQARPTFATDCSVVLLDGAVVVASTDKSSVLKNPISVSICELVDGESSVAAILGQLLLRYTGPEVLIRLKQLFDDGYLVQAGAGERLGCVHQASITPWLATLGTQLSRRLRRDCLVIEMRDPFDEQLGAQLAKARQTNQTVVLVHPYGDSPWISTPIASAKHDHSSDCACSECLMFWLRQNGPVQRFLGRQRRARVLHKAQVSAPSQTVIARLAHGLISHQQGQKALLSEGSSAVERTELIVCPAEREPVRHVVVSRPQCPGCGDASLMAEKSVRAPVLRKISTIRQGAGLRSQGPNETYLQYRHLVSPICGPIAYLHPMPRRHEQSRYVYAAGYLNCPRQFTGNNDYDKYCAGKGDHELQARTSALCETIERFSGMYQGDEARKRCRQAELGEPGYGFDELQQFSRRQKARRSQINKATSDLRKQIPLGFDRHTRIDWTPAWSLSRERQVWVPLSYCYAETPMESGTAYGIHNPNGCAAGVHLDEAILQGLFELIERDAVAIWWYNRLQRPRVDLADFDEPYWQRLADEYDAMDYDFWVLDLTHDLAIPCFTAIASHRHETHFAVGFGCHVDPKIAINRSITELNQLFERGENKVNPWNHELLANDAFLRPDLTQGSRQRADYPMVPTGSAGDVLKHCMDTLEQRGMETLVVDKSRPDIGLKVAQVIVPGLRHFWPRFGEGRLYEVPVEMGWRETVIHEVELNPAFLFL